MATYTFVPSYFGVFNLFVKLVVIQNISILFQYMCSIKTLHLFGLTRDEKRSQFQLPDFTCVA